MASRPGSSFVDHFETFLEAMGGLDAYAEHDQELGADEAALLEDVIAMLYKLEAWSRDALPTIRDRARTTLSAIRARTGAGANDGA